jgi:hypothetical protein
MRQSYKPPIRRETSPFERRAADLWDNSMRLFFLAALEAYPDNPSAVLKVLRFNFVHQVAEGFAEVSRLVIIETFDRPRAGGVHGADQDSR